VAPAAVFDYLERFQTHTNPFGRDLQFSLKRLYPQEWRRPAAKTAYFPGCVEIRYFPKTVGQTLELLRKNDSVSLYTEPIVCCGYPLYAAGDFRGFRELAEINSQSLKKYRRVVSGAPACLYTMETLYAEQGFKVPTRFFHIAERLDGGHRGRAGSPPIKARNPAVAKAGSERIAYHDPCYLGRYRGTYDQPRQLIESVTGCKPIEFFRNRQQGYCCGAGGLLPISSPETARKITENRLAEFRRTGAQTLVTSCPTCVRQFKKVDPSVDVRGLVEFLCQER